MCSPWQHFTRRPGDPKPVMCCLCCEWKSLDELAVTDDGQLIDICIDCDRIEKEMIVVSGRQLTDKEITDRM